MTLPQTIRLQQRAIYRAAREQRRSQAWVTSKLVQLYGGFSRGMR
jgi:hypothetical protein